MRTSFSEFRGSSAEQLWLLLGRESVKFPCVYQSSEANRLVNNQHTWIRVVIDRIACLSFNIG